MGYPTPIEWTDATRNPIGGCSIAAHRGTRKSLPGRG
jgi:protein gp37